MSATGRKISVVTAAWLLGAACVARPAPAATHPDWPMFGWDAGRSSAPKVSMGIAASDLHALRRQQVRIDGTVDASAIYLHGATVKGATHDVFFVTTTYGKTLAVDADHGTVLWEYTPSGYKSFAGTDQITTATPVADPDRQHIYAASPDGMIRKLAVADGRVVWRRAITRLPSREKIASPLAYFHGGVIAVTGGYIGDAPPYQGHVAILDAGTGALLHVWNALCSDRHELLDPTSCRQSDAAIWGRAGAVIDAATGHIFVATGNAPWNGIDDWGDVVIELNADATKILGNYTPRNTEKLNATDRDLGSSAPVLTGGPFIVQGGKDGQLRVLDWRKMAGTEPHRGGASSRVPTPGDALLFTAPAVLRRAAATWIYVADNRGTSAWTLGAGKLQPRWHNSRAGTSPVVADGLLFVYDPHGELRVYEAMNGRELADLACGNGHWNSPIVADGRIVLPEGSANAHQTSGVLDIWRVR
ncbi:MAG: PQQ-binding-like beta-propeller repeat protein [Xanthomonadaceae bacterium]|jgi:outer membrane protein assembly factor BamB|nr:PQQ-binding-like beta-propeller repeat protein [Xanthomonadaceae bacterium]MDE3071379.1 PQQ-binding-like beta-propeller repeat protein [Pseudomonadota bacterium]